MKHKMVGKIIKGDFVSLECIKKTISHNIADETIEYEIRTISNISINYLREPINDIFAKYSYFLKDESFSFEIKSNFTANSILIRTTMPDNIEKFEKDLIVQMRIFTSTIDLKKTIDIILINLKSINADIRYLWKKTLIE